MTKPKHETSVSSPTATGGAGTQFEQHVDAYWLAILLVNGIPPVLTDCVLEEVHFQTERLGWRTDDFLLVGKSGSGKKRRLAGQVKRTLTVSSKSEEFKKAITDAWLDFNSAEFDSAQDRFAFVVLRGTATLLNHFGGLLEAARTSRTAEELRERLDTPGLLDKRVGDRYDQVRASLPGNGSVPTEAIWRLLQAIHVISLDLATATAQTEALAKTLLAHTASHDGPAAANATWADLVVEAGHGMANASTYTRSTLSADLQERHSSVPTAETRALEALSQHSDLVLENIRCDLRGDLTLPRAELTAEILNSLEECQVVLVSGPSGIGKSALAKRVATLRATREFTFAFRAEEFACAHLDEALQRAQIGLRGVALAALLAGQDRKLLLIESVERLLESTVRDAFFDLLQLVRRDPTWRVLLTCRDYSTDLVRSSFLEHVGVEHRSLVVSALDDDELLEVEKHVPALVRPLGKPALRELLRNPFFLNMAGRMSWSESESLPDNERSFRIQFFRDVVRMDRERVSGRPQRREAAFVQIAVRRAKALTAFADSTGLDPEAIQLLQRDSLLLTPDGGNSRAAPSHDVLEDWALLHWLEARAVRTEHSVQGLAEDVGDYPALRRAYRRFLAELVQRDESAAETYFREAAEASVPRHVQDDTLVSLLQSPDVGELLERNREILLRDGRSLLHRVAFLMRVACVGVPDWLGATVKLNYLVPQGECWEGLLRLVARSLEVFDGPDLPHLLELLDDWGKGVSWLTPSPAGQVEAATVGHWLLERLTGYDTDDDRKRVLRVLVKIPLADKARFLGLLEGAHAKPPKKRGTRRSPHERAAGRNAEELSDLILNGIEGSAVARDLPKETVELALEAWLLPEPDDEPSQRWQSGSSIGTERSFGLSPSTNFDFGTASAYRGPFLALLRHHPRLGLSFLVKLVNRCTDWYATPRISRDHLEAPSKIRLTVNGSQPREQWASARLWCLYRGLHVGPNVLRCALMAMEHFLLERCEAGGEGVSKHLDYLLRESDSAATTAVVASVVTAHPSIAGESLLSLLSCREFIDLDRERMVAESQTGVLAGLLPHPDPSNRVFEDERKQSNQRPQRQDQLEGAVLRAQVGPLGDRIQQLLDSHLKVLPPAKEQSDEDRLWRLAIHRMDLRRFKPVSAKVPEAEEGDQRSVSLLLLEEPEQDIVRMLEDRQPAVDVFQSEISLFHWGNVHFRREATDDTRAEWKKRLAQARGVDGPGELYDGRCHVAAVCIRDHWEELDDTEGTWCVTTVVDAVESTAATDDIVTLLQRGGMSPDRPAAWILPLLLTKSLPAQRHSRVLAALATALTHPVAEVVEYACTGLAEALHQLGSLGMRCVNALALEARLVQEQLVSDLELPYAQRRLHPQIEWEVGEPVREFVVGGSNAEPDQLRSFRATGWKGSSTLLRLMLCLRTSTRMPESVWVYEQAARVLAWTWAREQRDDESSPDLPDERDGLLPSREVRVNLPTLLERFVQRVESEEVAARIVSPLVEAAGDHPGNARLFLSGLLGATSLSQIQRFWAVWQRFADTLKCVDWHGRADRYRGCDEFLLVSTVFLGGLWKSSVRHWEGLEGYEDRIPSLFNSLPATATVTEAYVQHLYDIGERSLPGAFVLLAERLRGGKPKTMLGVGNTRFMLELLLGRHVYGRPVELKQDARLRQSVLFLLDTLVELGSSAAYRMRDDFVTPLQAASFLSQRCQKCGSKEGAVLVEVAPSRREHRCSECRLEAAEKKA